MRTSKPITVTLGELQERVEARVKSGAYTSASDVLRAGLRALDREDTALEAVIRQRVQEALDNPEPPLTHEQVFGELRVHHVREALARTGDVLPWRNATTPPPKNMTREELIAGMEDIAARCVARPVVDPRSIDDIIGYDDFGLPR